MIHAVNIVNYNRSISYVNSIICVNCKNLLNNLDIFILKKMVKRISKSIELVVLQCSLYTSVILVSCTQSLPPNCPN